MDINLNKDEISIQDMHNIVEGALEKVNPAVAKSYRDYRNYKHDFIHMMDEVYTKSQSIRYIGDKSNANTDSALVATKRILSTSGTVKPPYCCAAVLKIMSPITSKAVSSVFGSLYHTLPISNPPLNTFATSNRQQFIVSRRAD